MLKRRIVLFAPALALLAVVLPSVLLAGRLPDPIASHFDFSGRADASAGLAISTAAFAAAVAVAWAFLVRQAAVRDRALRLTAAPWVWAAAAFAAGLHGLVLAANLDEPSWRTAELPPWTVLNMLSFAFAFGLTAHVLERARPVAVVSPAGGLGLGLRPGERAVWSASARGRVAAIAAPVLGGGFVAAGALTSAWWLVPAGAVLGVAIASVSQIAATVDRRGLTIAYGPLGWPRQRVALEDVASAERTDIDPWRVGGWGVRKVPTRPGTTAIVVRAGDGMRVVRRDGRELLVTVPDAATGAALLNELSDRG